MTQTLETQNASAELDALKAQLSGAKKRLSNLESEVRDATKTEADAKAALAFALATGGDENTPRTTIQEASQKLQELKGVPDLVRAEISRIEGEIENSQAVFYAALIGERFGVAVDALEAFGEAFRDAWNNRLRDLYEGAKKATQSHKNAMIEAGKRTPEGSQGAIFKDDPGYKNPNAVLMFALLPFALRMEKEATEANKDNE